MQINTESLVKLLNEAFTSGQNSPYDLKDQAIEEILSTKQTTTHDTWVVLPVTELRCLPSGRKIFHSMFGEGILMIKNGERFVQFAGFRMELTEEGWPWDQKIQIIS